MFSNEQFIFNAVIITNLYFYNFVKIINSAKFYSKFRLQMHLINLINVTNFSKFCIM